MRHQQRAMLWQSFLCRCVKLLFNVSLDLSCFLQGRQKTTNSAGEGEVAKDTAVITVSIFPDV